MPPASGLVAVCLAPDQAAPCPDPHDFTAAQDSKQQDWGNAADPAAQKPHRRRCSLSAAQREAAQDRHSSVCAAFLFLFAGREVGLPSRRRAFLAWGSGDYLDLFFLGFLFLPIAFLFASGHVNLLWLMNRLSPPGNYGLAIAGEQGYPRKKPQIDSYVGRQTRWIKVKNRGQPALERVLDFCRARAQ